MIWLVVCWSWWRCMLPLWSSLDRLRIAEQLQVSSLYTVVVRFYSISRLMQQELRVAFTVIGMHMRALMSLFVCMYNVCVHTYVYSYWPYSMQRDFVRVHGICWDELAETCGGISRCGRISRIIRKLMLMSASSSYVQCMCIYDFSHVGDSSWDARPIIVPLHFNLCRPLQCCTRDNTWLNGYSFPSAGTDDHWLRCSNQENDRGIYPTL